MEESASDSTRDVSMDASSSPVSVGGPAPATHTGSRRGSSAPGEEYRCQEAVLKERKKEGLTSLPQPTHINVCIPIVHMCKGSQQGGTIRGHHLSSYTQQVPTPF